MLNLANKAGEYVLGGDLVVNRMGFGAMRLTGPGVWGQPKDKSEAISVLRTAMDLGVNFIDTSDAYGPFVSEEIIFEALYPYPKDLVIATKGGLVRNSRNHWGPKGSADHLRKAVEGSLKRLKLDCIDLYQLHRIDPNVGWRESLGVLSEMKQEGKIKYIGLSEVSVEVLDEISSEIEVTSVQNLYNLTDRKHESVLKYCEENGMAFIPWYPLGAGDLLGSDEMLQDMAKKYQATDAQIVLAWLIKKSPSILLIPGTSSVKHLEENIKAVEVQLGESDFDILTEDFKFSASSTEKW